MDWFSSNYVTMAQKSLDYNWQKIQVISENIANAETPGYKAKYVTFEEELKRNLSSASSKSNRTESVRNAIGSAKISVLESTDETTRADGNNVNADVENVELARAQLQYDMLVKQINGEFSKLRAVIGG